MARTLEKERVNREIELDAKDKSIIYELSIDSGQSGTDIAKKTGMSAQVIAYRLKELIDKKVVRCNSIINLTALGYRLFDVFVQYRSAPDEKELAEELDRNESVVEYCRCTGKYDLHIKIAAKDNQQAGKAIDEINHKLNGFVRKKEIIFVESTAEYGKKYLNTTPASKTQRIIRLSVTDSEEKIDKTDAIILRALASDSRTSLLELSEKTKLTANAIGHRIKSLTQKGIICGSTAHVGKDVMKKETAKVLVRTASSERKKALETYAQKNINITQIDCYAGQWDICMTLESDNIREEMLSMRNAFSDSIEDFEILITEDLMKNNYFPMKP